MGRIHSSAGVGARRRDGMRPTAAAETVCAPSQYSVQGLAVTWSGQSEVGVTA